ncbi:response regulator transcription factor [Blautia sp. HCP3S3_D9]|uniref:response regulator transcription factor n=1 Tax=Lachnospiraceae TaxID=186803 RepID=UPI003F89CAC7
MKQSKKILIVDDEKKITEVLQAYLEKAGYLTVVAYDGRNAIKLAETETPDLILLDLMLPDIMGEEVCQVIHQKKDIPIIMLTARVDESDMIAGLQCGADDYIVKPFSPRNVIARVEAVLRRVERSQPEILKIGTDYLDVNFQAHSIKKNNEELHLTPTEYNIFELLVKSPGRAFTREQIIDFALKDEFDGYDRSVDTYIKYLRQKIEPDPKSPQYIVTIYGVGYKFVP